ncbi:type II toxin-antitoxin system HicB family antitoxin [Xanthomonas campestris pv. zinniae]|nr:type II toxin-antitoxin system HicB family antitoxin [Xanthomonas campestris pv. zinniae]
MNETIHKINLRLPMHVVEEAKAQAALLGVSLNAYILFAVSEQVKRTRNELAGPVVAPKPKAKPKPAGRTASMPSWDDPVVGLSRHTCENDSQNPISFVKTGSCQIRRRFHRSSTTSSLSSFGTLPLSCGDCARPVGRRVGNRRMPPASQQRTQGLFGSTRAGIEGRQESSKKFFIDSKLPHSWLFFARIPADPLVFMATSNQPYGLMCCRRSL